MSKYIPIERKELQVGDEVQIANGDYLELVKVDFVEKGYDGYNVYSLRVPYSENLRLLDDSPLITGFQRKVDEPLIEKWLNKETIAAIHKKSTTREEVFKNIESHLQEVHGEPPVIYTFNGEPAEQFGLKYNDYIHRFNDYNWSLCIYAYMCIGDKWMKQPQPPK